MSGVGSVCHEENSVFVYRRENRTHDEDNEHATVPQHGPLCTRRRDLDSAPLHPDVSTMHLKWTPVSHAAQAAPQSTYKNSYQVLKAA